MTLTFLNPDGFCRELVAGSRQTQEQLNLHGNACGLEERHDHGLLHANTKHVGGCDEESPIYGAKLGRG